MSDPVAIVHDSLAVKGGAERVVLAMANAMPGASVHTSIFVPERTHDEFSQLDVRVNSLDRISVLRRDHRRLLPVLAASFRRRVIDAEVVVCSSSGFSHHVKTTGAKIVYCHTPARWMYDSERYLAEWSSPVRVAAAVLAKMQRPVDQQAMAEADLIVANSRHVASEIEAIYGRAATVLAPCSTLDLEGPLAPIAGVSPGFVLTVSRVLGYKRLDVLIDAARNMPDTTFLHLGGGPHHASVLEQAPPNLVTQATVTDAHLRWAYRNARCAVLTCAEDFGLVPLEADAHGLPVAMPRARGLLDHDALASGTWFYTHGSATALVDTLQRIDDFSGGQSGECAIVPERLGRERFVERLGSLVARVGAGETSPMTGQPHFVAADAQTIGSAEPAVEST